MSDDDVHKHWANNNFLGSHETTFLVQSFSNSTPPVNDKWRTSFLLMSCKCLQTDEMNEMHFETYSVAHNCYSFQSSHMELLNFSSRWKLAGSSPSLLNMARFFKRWFFSCFYREWSSVHTCLWASSFVILWTSLSYSGSEANKFDEVLFLILT